MSFDAIKWAFKQQTKKSTEKLVLLSLANCVNSKHTDLAFPSAKRICEETQLNKKTIYTALGSLIEQNLIADTEQKVGRTQSVKVYKLNMQADPKTDQLSQEDLDEAEEISAPENGLTKHTRKRVSIESEADPKTDRSTPENGPKLTRKRIEADPKTGHGTSKEPVKEPVNNKIYTDHTNKKDLNFYRWPTVPDEEIFKDWKAARKLKKQTLTQTVINQFGDEITKAANHGFSVDQCLAEVCARGWQGFKAEWMDGKVTPINKNKFSGFDQIDYQAQAEAEGFRTDIPL